MAKEKDLVPFTPPTEEEIMLIQPNNVTFGQYNISEWQENLLTLISDKLQKHMSREEELPRDLFNQPYVTIKCDEAGGKNHKTMVLKEALDLTKKIFSFRWVHPKIHKTIETTACKKYVFHAGKELYSQGSRNVYGVPAGTRLHERGNSGVVCQFHLFWRWLLRHW